MKKLLITSEDLTDGARIVSDECGTYRMEISKKGAGFALPDIKCADERYLVFRVRVTEEHSLAMNFFVYERGESSPAFTVRFGLLPTVDATACIDLYWMDASELFPEAMPGTLKIVCHGRRVHRDRIDKVVLSTLPSFHDVTLTISDIELTDDHPNASSLPDVKMVDIFGQSKWKDWKGKTKDIDELRGALEGQLAEASGSYPFADFTEYGGWRKNKLCDGTGFFTKCKENGRWWLVDPLGYAFFSMGPDCVGLGGDCRIDGVEKWLDRLPDKDDGEFGGMYFERPSHGGGRAYKTFSFFRSNLYRAFGDGWHEKWRTMLIGQLKLHGMNTLGNWSDGDLLGTTGMPYVTSLPRFPSTKQNIFRDFPDVLSDEYAENAEACARSLERRKDDPLMIGYFLRNEPAWAFVDNLVIADEVLYNPARTVCKDKLIEFLKDRYHDVAELNRAWNSSYESFADLYQSQSDVSKLSEASSRDMHEFSRIMLRAYVEIPSRACRKVDPNHMILGMRWAWISDSDLVTGWENFDVFSINCYAVDPTSSIQRIVDLGVDLPVMIGEFHFGALDAGLPATGLEGVADQHERGVAYRYYCESVAAHPYGVGCHYFQCYDQFTLGRFDGENYNIGLFDICSRVYPEMMNEIRDCAGSIYLVADGKKERTSQRPATIPMIAY